MLLRVEEGETHGNLKMFLMPRCSVGPRKTLGRHLPMPGPARHGSLQVPTPTGTPHPLSPHFPQRRWRAHMATHTCSPWAPCFGDSPPTQPPRLHPGRSKPSLCAQGMDAGVGAGQLGKRGHQKEKIKREKINSPFPVLPAGKVTASCTALASAAAGDPSSSGHMLPDISPSATCKVTQKGFQRAVLSHLFACSQRTQGRQTGAGGWG